MTQPKLAPGMVLGRYELLLPIAQGGMATVWAARQKGSRGFQKTVAVKTMLPNLSDDPQFEQMFLDEASLAAKIHHPNVAEILDLGEQDEVLYLVMEWVDGEALSVVTRTAKRSDTHVPQRIVLRIVGQACAGLHAAHELKDENEQLLKLVHRDVSPQNILVTYDGIVKLVDFGVAKAVGRAGGETTAGQLKGKVPYMSPEQARGGTVDRRTDVFAMGIVLYKLTVGVHPFLGESDMVTMRNIIMRPVLSPRMKNPNFSPDLEQVLMKCLQKDPERRYQTVADLDRAIDRVLAVTGASVVDDDVGAFVRAVMGERGPKRRAALRDAVRTADERAAGIAMTPGTSAALQQDVSDLMITKMASAVKEEMLPERLSELGPPPPPLLPALPPPLPVPRMPEPEEMSAYEEVVTPKRSRRGFFLALGGTTLAVSGIAFALLRSPAVSTALPKVQNSNAASAPPPSAAAPVASATAAPDASGETPATMSVKDLPDDKAGSQGGKRRPGAAPPRSGAPDKDPGPPPTKPTSTAWVPTVQNPGF